MLHRRVALVVAWAIGIAVGLWAAFTKPTQTAFVYRKVDPMSCEEIRAIGEELKTFLEEHR